MRYHFPLLLGLLGASWASWAAEGGPTLEPVASLIDGQTFAVARVDLARIDAGATLQAAARFANDAIPPEELKTRAAQLQGFLATLREYGARDAYILFSLADIPENVPPLLLTLKPGANEALISTHLKQIGSLPWPEQARLNNLIAFGAPSTLERLKKNKPVERRDLAAAFAACGDMPVQVAAAIPADAQRVVRELLTRLPPEIGGGEGQDLLNGLQWMSVALQPPPKLALHWHIQSKDEASAADLRPRILAGLNMLLQGPQTRLPEARPGLAELAIRLTPKVNGDHLELKLAGDEAEKVASELAAGPFGVLRDSAAKAQSINQLKQMGLAMHNYHDVNRHFPPAAFLSKEGKPLLSWRVHILPYMEQTALYRQFHLDEPWDSEHNAKLIAQMPKAYLNPVHPKLAKEGKTTYVTPVGAGTVFGEKDGTYIGKILDGTSNTVMVVDLPPENAVIWTKPEDWEFNSKDPGKGLLDGKRESFLAAFCDGSVHAIPANVDLSDLRRLVIKDDGEVLTKQY